MERPSTPNPCEPLNERYSRYEEAQLLLAELRDLYVQWNEWNPRNEVTNGYVASPPPPSVASKPSEAPLVGAALRSSLTDLGALATTDVFGIAGRLMQQHGVAADGAKLGALHSLLTEMILTLHQSSSAPRVAAPRPYLSSEALKSLARDAPHLGLCRGDPLHVPLSTCESSQIDLMGSPDLAMPRLPGRRVVDMRRANAERHPHLPHTNPKTPQCVLRFNKHTNECQRYFKSTTPFARLCTSAPHMVRPALRDLERERVCHFRGSSEAHEPRSPVSFVAFNSTGTRAIVTACQEPGEATLYDLCVMANTVALEGHKSTVSDCAFACDDSVAFTAGHDGVARVWNANTGLLIHELSSGAAPTILVAPHSMKAKLLATAGQNKTIQLWDVYTGTIAQSLHELPGVRWTGAAAQLSFLRHSARSDVLMAGLDVDTREAVASLVFYQLAPAGASLLRVYEEHSACIGGCAAAPHTDSLVLSGSSRVLLLNDLRQSQATRRLMIPQTDVHCVAFSNCERFVCSGGNDNTALVFDMRFGHTPLYVLAHDAAPHTGTREPNQNQGVMAIAWLGAYLLSAGEDGALRTWDVSVGDPQLHKAVVHSAPMSAMAVSAQHDLILTGADDCKAVLHTLPGDMRRLPAVI